MMSGGILIPSFTKTGQITYTYSRKIHLPTFFSKAPPPSSKEEANRDNREKGFSYSPEATTTRVASHMRLAQAVSKNDLFVFFLFWCDSPHGPWPPHSRGI